MPRAMSEPRILAIDVGTSAVRATLVEQSGRIVLAATDPLPLENVSRDGLDVEAIWGGIVNTVRRLQPERTDVEAIGVSAQLSLVLIDADGRPTRPGLPWTDRRAVTEADELARLGATAALVTGRRSDPELWAAKLMWLRRHEPDALDRARWALSLKDYLVFRLSGNVVTDETHASYTFLYDVAARSWSNDLIDACGLERAKLPQVQQASAVAGYLGSDAAGALGLRPGVPVAVGGPDGTLGALGAGAVRPGVTVDVAGSTDVLLHVVDRPRADPAAEAVMNAHAAPGLWTLGGPTGMTGGAAAWIAHLLGIGIAELYQRWGAAAAEVAPGAAGLLFVTTLTGGRFPRWSPDEAGSIHGLRPTHGPADLLRAAEEGAVFVVLEGLEALSHLGCEIAEVVVVGGVAARPSALQLRADAWGIPVRSLANAQASTIGAAALAAAAAGLAPSVADAVDAMVVSGSSFEPIATQRDKLRSLFERWRDRQLDPVHPEATHVSA